MGVKIRQNNCFKIGNDNEKKNQGPVVFQSTVSITNC